MAKDSKQEQGILLSQEDLILPEGNLTMNHVEFLFQSLLQPSLTSGENIGRKFGEAIIIQDHGSNDALKTNIENFLVGQAPVTAHGESERKALNMTVGDERVLLLLNVQDSNIITGDLPKTVRSSKYNHWTALNLKKSNKGKLIVRYADSLIKVDDKNAPLPESVLAALNQVCKANNVEIQKELFNSTPQTLLNCGYNAVFHALQMLELSTASETIEGFIGRVKPILIANFGKAVMKRGVDRKVKVGEEDAKGDDSKSNMEPESRDFEQNIDSSSDDDPFKRQLDAHYKGVLTKLKSFTDDTFKELLDKTSLVISKLDGDERIVESEKVVREKIGDTLKRNLIFSFAESLLGKEEDIDPQQQILDSFNVDIKFFSKENNDEWQQYIKCIQDNQLFNLKQLKRIRDRNDSITFRKVWDKPVNNITEPYVNYLNLWENTIDLRLKLYGKKLIEIEERWIEMQENEVYERHIQYQTALQEAEGDLDGLEQDYDGLIYPTPSEYGLRNGDYGIYSDDDLESDGDNFDLAPPSNNNRSKSDGETEDDKNRFYTLHHQEFSDPSNFRNLIAISGGFQQNGLSWLTNQIAEYEDEDIWEYIIEKILTDPELEELMDKDLLYFIMYSATEIDSDDDLIRAFSSGSLARDYDDEWLIEGKIFVRTIKKYLSELSVKRLKKDIDNEFAYAKEIIDGEHLEELRNQYNKAYKENDLVTQNQSWAVFDLLLKKLKLAKQDHDDDIGMVLEQSKEEYWKRAKSYYFRIYPEHSTNKLIYSAKNPRKVAQIDMAPLLGELEEVGRNFGKILQDAFKNPKDQTNIVTPILCFVVTDRPHKKGGEHKRIIVPVALEFLKYKNALLSRDLEDEVFKKEDGDYKEFFEEIDEVTKEKLLSKRGKKAFQVKDQNQYYKKGNELLSAKGKFFRQGAVVKGSFERDYSLDKQDTKIGVDIIKRKTPDTTQKPYKVKESQIKKTFDHSERVLFRALRDKENIGTIVNSLKKKLENRLAQGKLESGKYKVYSAALLTYSTHGICQYCSAAFIAHQTHSKDSFLDLLAKNINSSENFKTRGFDFSKNPEKRLQKVREKFHLSTIVTSDRTHSEQSVDMNEIATDQNEKKLDSKDCNSNPKSRIYLDNNTIDLHKTENFVDKKGRLSERGQSSFYEFVGARFSDKSKKIKSGSTSSNNSVFSGKSFMSGSKKIKSKTEMAVNAINKSSARAKSQPIIASDSPNPETIPTSKSALDDSLTESKAK